MLNSRFAVALTLVLLLEGVLYYSAYAKEQVPQSRPLDFFAAEFGGWHMTQGGQVAKDVQDVLRADDTMARTYQKDAETVATLFVAYFKTQRAGQAPHSPKNCLPGAGWEPRQEGFIDVNVATDWLSPSAASRRSGSMPLPRVYSSASAMHASRWFRFAARR